jgi:hypothetical protein
MLAAVAAIVVAVYWPGLNGPLLLDDRPNLASLAAVDGGHMDAWDYVKGSDGAVVRPVSRASFLLDWWLWGDQVRAFKSVNLALHLICGLLVFALARALLAPRLEDRAACTLALFVCAAWLLAPLQVSTVLYTVQRMAQLAALFTFAGLLLFVHARRTGSRPSLMIAFAVCWPLAALSKENGALLPLLALVVEWWLPGRAEDTRRVRRLLLALVALPALTLAARVALDPQWLLAGYQGREFTLAERVLTQPRALLDYLGNLLLLPGASPMGILRDDFPVSTALTAPVSTAMAALTWLGLAVAALVSRGTVFAPAGFGIAFFLAGHAVESTVFPLELYFEHRNYLPAFGVFISLGWCVWLLVPRLGARWCVALTGVLCLQFAVVGWQRVAIWRDESSLYTHAVQAHPLSARAHLGLAAVQLSARQFDAGSASLDRAARLLTDNARVGLALQLMAAYCLHGHQIPGEVYARIERADTLGDDLYTLNALAWTAGAVASGACRGLDRARLMQALSTLNRAPIAWAPERQRLRDAHLEGLLQALATTRP